MLKKRCAFLVSVILLLCISIPALAAESDPARPAELLPHEATTLLGQNTTVLSVEKTVDEEGNVCYQVLTEEIPLTRSTYEKGYMSTVFFYNSKEVLLWDAALRAYFTVNEGVSVTCSRATKEFNVFKENWSCATSPTRSGNKATWNIEAKQKILGIVVETQKKTLIIACDKYGDRV